MRSPERDASVSEYAAAQRGPLSDREFEVVDLIARGYTNREIAEALIIVEGTAVKHVPLGDYASPFTASPGRDQGPPP